MTTRDIAQDEWATFFDTFSKEHQGLLATVHVISADLGAQEAAKDLPFVGISADQKGSDHNSITIFLGTEADDHIEHRVVSPTRTWLKSTGEPATDVIEVEAVDGSKTIIELQQIPGLPA